MSVPQAFPRAGGEKVHIDTSSNSGAQSLVVWHAVMRRQLVALVHDYNWWRQLGVALVWCENLFLDKAGRKRGKATSLVKASTLGAGVLSQWLPSRERDALHDCSREES